MEIKKGDVVEVKKGIIEPDLGEFELSGWKGEITDRYKFEGNYIIEITWNIETLQKIPKKFIKESLKDGYSFSKMHLEENEVFKIDEKLDDSKERDRLKRRLELEQTSGSRNGYDEQDNY